jgi:hypothetical protein
LSEDFSGGNNYAKESVAAFWFIESSQPDKAEQRATAQQYAPSQFSTSILPPYGAKWAAKAALEGNYCVTQSGGQVWVIQRHQLQLVSLFAAESKGSIKQSAAFIVVPKHAGVAREVCRGSSASAGNFLQTGQQ